MVFHVSVILLFVCVSLICRHVCVTRSDELTSQITIFKPIYCEDIGIANDKNINA